MSGCLSCITVVLLSTCHHSLFQICYFVSLIRPCSHFRYHSRFSRISHPDRTLLLHTFHHVFMRHSLLGLSFCCQSFAFIFLHPHLRLGVAVSADVWCRRLLLHPCRHRSFLLTHCSGRWVSCDVGRGVPGPRPVRTPVPLPTRIPFSLPPPYFHLHPRSPVPTCVLLRALSFPLLWSPTRPPCLGAVCAAFPSQRTVGAVYLSTRRFFRGPPFPFIPPRLRLDCVPSFFVPPDFLEL